MILVVAITAIAYGLYDKGIHAGQRAEASSQVQASKTEFERIETTFNAQLSAANTAADKYQQMVSALVQQAQQSAGKAQAAVAAETVDNQKLAAVPDPEIQKDLETKLGGPLTSPAILRLDDSMVTDYPSLKAEAESLASEVGTQQTERTAEEQELAAVSKERDSAVEAHDEIIPLYAQAYNAAVVSHRHFWCLWICKSKPLTLAKPDTLRRNGS
jgi:Tfp pilus assembly protein PilE